MLLCVSDASRHRVHDSISLSWASAHADVPTEAEWSTADNPEPEVQKVVGVRVDASPLHAMKGRRLLDARHHSPTVIVGQARRRHPDPGIPPG